MSWLEDITSSIKYIEGHLTDELTLEKIAAKINLSPFYFQKGFSILCGITVSEYIRNRRLSLAGRDLQTDGVKVIDVAMILQTALRKPSPDFTVLRLHRRSPETVNSKTTFL